MLTYMNQLLYFLQEFLSLDNEFSTILPKYYARENSIGLTMNNSKKYFKNVQEKVS